jgi:hypothetical protein
MVHASGSRYLSKRAFIRARTPHIYQYLPLDQEFDLTMAAQSPERQPPFAVQSTGLLHLPAEILLLVASFLPNRDLKSLRLASKQLGETTPLSFSRVFLSANSLDIKVLRSVANHPDFREQVTEIIWDDARFVSAPVSWEDHEPFIDRSGLKINDEGCPKWFLQECKNNISNMKQRKSRDVDRPDHTARQRQVDAQMPLKDCWKYYSQVLNDQQAVINLEMMKKPSYMA